MNIQQEVDLDAEIDPQLFLKCRLCIEENGSYQIHQSVQKQIEYCFDITVKHHDRLSQLICRKCKVILNGYSETKKRFLENQNLLQKLNAPKIDENTDPCLPVISPPIKTYSDETDVSPKAENKSWQLCFNKKYVCRFCTLHFSTRKRIRRHYKIHSKLLSACKKQINKHCQIQLDRWDERLNLTGGSEAVVLSADRIIVDEGKINYYVAYQPKEEIRTNEKDSACSKRIYYSGTSDEDDFLAKPQRKKRKNRCLSRSSSNETVVIDGHKSTAEAVEDEADIINYGTDTVTESLKELSVDTCINIDDSSNEASDTTERQSAQTDQTKHMKEIQTITSMCYAKYINNCSNEVQVEKSKKDAHLDETLNRKLLSIGRKVMSTQGISSPGLLKYLQHKNLAINWFPNVKAIDSFSKHANYIRIMTKLAVPANHLSGWAPVTVNEDLSESSEADASPKRVDISNVIGQIHIPVNKSTVSDTVTLNPIPTSETDSTMKKLLNANPVANPKTLPKKATCQESKPELVKQQSKANNTSESICIESDDDSTTNDADLSMPIIMSTTSLAEHPPKPTEINVTSTTSSPVNLNNGTEKAYPRIKCKPVSELMAPNKLNGQDNKQTVIVTLPAPALQVNSSIGPQSPVAILPKLAPAPLKPLTPALTATNMANDSEHITMNSIDLPNKSTSNPIDYFRILLEMHGIVLVTQKNVQLEKTFVSLVKFKLDISRQDRSVIVGLSLFARNNIFCIKLRKINGEEMDIDTLPTFWQMHILKSFEGEVSDKILNLATRVSHALYTYAKKFVSLLKSIEYKSPNSSS